MNLENFNPAATIRRVLEGNLDSFREIVQACEGDVQAVVKSLLENRTGTRDLVQQTFIRVYQHLDRYDPARGEFRLWVKGIARHVVQGELRRRGREQACLTRYWAHLNTRCEGIEADDERMETLRGHLNACLEKLTGDAAQIIELRYKKGLPMEEIASLMGRSSDTALKLLSRARLALRDCAERRLSVNP